MEQDAWGLEPQRPDHPADPELGWTTSEDDPVEWPAAPSVTHVTRTGFVGVFLLASGRAAWTVGLWTRAKRINRRRRYL